MEMESSSMWIVNDGRYDDPDESCEEDELYAVCKGNHDDVRFEL